VRLQAQVPRLQGVGFDQEHGALDYVRQLAHVAEPGEACQRGDGIRTDESNGWNVSEAARRLGVSREVLRYRMRKYAITPPAR